MGRKVYDISVSIVQIVGLAIVVLYYRVTYLFTRPRSVWEPSQPSAIPTDDRELDDLIEEMASKGDQLADDTIEELYKIGGIPAVEAANWLMQKRADDDEEDPVHGEPSERHEKICCCIRDHLEHKSGVLFSGFDEQQLKVIGDIVKNYLDTSATPPSWYDENLIKQGEEVFGNYGMLGYTVLGCASLPTGYAAPQAARVLGFTQQLEDINIARRRLIETSLFILQVKDQGGLAFPSGQGIRGIQSVRLMHAGVRKLLLTPPPKSGECCFDGLFDCLLRHQWDKEKNGIPVHQILLCATILCFSYVALRSIRHLGFDLNDEEQRAYLHCWNVAGLVMGIREELLAYLNPGKEKVEDAERLFLAIWKRYGGQQSRDGIKLTESLLTFMESPLKEDGKSRARLRVRLFDFPVLLPLHRVPRMLIRHLIGKQGTDVLGIRLVWWERFILWLLAPTLQRVPDLRKSEWFAPLFKKWLRMPSEEVAHQIFKGFLADPKNWPRKGRPPYKIPTRLNEKWCDQYGIACDAS